MYAYNEIVKDIYVAYNDIDSTITLKQEFIDKYKNKTLQVQIEGAVSEHHHDIFYDEDFGIQTPTYYEIHLDENGEVVEQEIEVFGKNRSQCLANFIPYETDIYCTGKSFMKWSPGESYVSTEYGFLNQVISLTARISFELLGTELIVHLTLRDKN